MTPETVPAKTAKPQKIRTMIIDNHHIVRTALSLMLNMESDIKVVGEVGDAKNLFASVEELQPDVLVMDIAMPNHNPVATVQTLVNLYPQMHVIVFSGSCRREEVVELLKVGVDGYVMKDDYMDSLPEAIRAVMQGHEWVSSRVTEVLIRSFRNNQVSQSTSMTDREAEVLRWLALGYTNQEIAEKLTITEKTVKNHITSILRTLNVRTRVEAALCAISMKLVSLDEIQEIVGFDQ
jgi:NarL family two-component system response regulator LiaR